MYYHLILVLDENTFRSSALTYTLDSNNIDDNGYTVPEIITQTGIKTGEREIFLGNGMFTPTNNENKVHSYTLKLYFPKIEHFEHGIDQGKTFKAHIETREGKVYPGYNEEKGVNHPVLFTGMTPVKWDGITEIKTTEDDPDWYDYDEKRWANAKSADGSYWVWIPRYAYKIETCYHTSGEDCYELTGKYAGDVKKILKIVKGRWQIEESFRIMKSDFLARPVELSREDRIKSHFTTCFIALLIYRILEKRLNGKYTTTEILDCLKGMKLFESKGDGYMPAYERTDLIDDLHEIFKFRTDYEINTYQDIEKILGNINK